MFETGFMHDQPKAVLWPPGHRCSHSDGRVLITWVNLCCDSWLCHVVNVRRQWKGTAGGCNMRKVGQCSWCLDWELLIVTVLYCCTEDWEIGFSLHEKLFGQFCLYLWNLYLSQYINYPLYLQCPPMAAVRLIFCAATSRPHPSDIPTHRNEACACTRSLNKEGLDIRFCPRHVRMTLQQTK